jgi:hypothetical protein
MEALLNRLWNATETAPGMQQVGHGLATVLGLYTLDQWLTRREVTVSLRLANQLDTAGFPEHAEQLRTAAVERITRP